MNYQKVADALRQTDQLVCGGLVYSGGRCAVGQLFFAAGKTETEIQEEENKTEGGYHTMFDNLLVEEYGMIEADANALWQLNDIEDYEGRSNDTETCADRQMRMLGWAEAQA